MEILLPVVKTCVGTCVKNRKDIFQAIKGGNFSKFVELFLKDDEHETKELFDSAIISKKNVTTILDFLQKFGYEWDNDDAFTSAMETGNLKTMDWLKKQGSVLTEMTFATATKLGNIRVLEWLKKNECPWDALTFTTAAFHGNVQVLKWLKKNGCPFDQGTYDSVKNNESICNNSTILKWFAEFETLT
jgi:hypothetical protein